MALQLKRKGLRSTRGIPFQTCRGGGRESWKSNTQCAPKPPLAKQHKEILEVWFYNCPARKKRVEKYPGNPLSDMQGEGEEKVGNPTHNVPLSPSYPNSTRKSLGFGSTVALGTSGYGASAASPPTELIYMWLGLLARLVCYRRQYRYHWCLQNSTI